MIWHGCKWVLARLFRARKTDDDLDEEIRAHFAIETERRIDAGESPDVARLGATRDFGNIGLVKEVTRQA